MQEKTNGRQTKSAANFEKIPKMGTNSAGAQNERLAFLEEKFGPLPYIRGEKTLAAEDLAGNCESFVGWWRHPLQIAGPVYFKSGTAINDEHIYIPLATHEGTLAASATRGSFVMNYSGGLETEFISHNMVKAPLLRFESFADSVTCQSWIAANMEMLRDVAREKPDGSTSRFTKLVNIEFIHGPGCDLILRIIVETGAAVGQNMATFASEAVLNAITSGSPAKPTEINIGCGMSGEKKPTALNLLRGRGCKVRGRVVLEDKYLRRFLRCSAFQLKRYMDNTIAGNQLSGSGDPSIHQSNALAARLLAHGQDEASVHESANTTIKYLLSEDAKQLEVSILAPNLAVGTIGGFTNKGVATETMRIIGCDDPFAPEAKMRLAQVDLATILALEISIAGALNSREFAGAHDKYGR